MAKQETEQERLQRSIDDIKKLDQTFAQVMRDNAKDAAGTDRQKEANDLLNRFNDLINQDAYNFNRNKSISQSSYSYMANMLVGKPLTDADKKNPEKMKAINMENKSKLEELFSNGNMQMAGYFLNQASDTYHILDEVESVCAYLYQLDEAINVLRDNVLNNEQSLTDLPFDVTFDGIDSTKSAEYIKLIQETFTNNGMKQKLNDHIVPKALKFGKYYVLTIPYSEIGVKMLDKSVNQTHSLFNFGGMGYTEIGVGESSDNTPDELSSCMENVNKIIEGIYEENEDNLKRYGGKEAISEAIKTNLENISISDAPTPPNVTGISEASFSNMSPDLQKEVAKALAANEKKFNYTTKYTKKTNEKTFADAIIDNKEEIPGCYIKLVDPRQMVPIKIFDHTIGFYYFENYDYAKMHTSITDILCNRINFNDQNMVIDNLVGTVLRKLKYGDVLAGDSDFKALILNCILYAERRNNPIRIKFIPCEYITEFKTNCDENGNGLPILLKSVIFGRMYLSLLFFNLTAIFTKSTDTEFYYLRENAITPSFQEQAADIIEQFRNSNIDISSVLNGNIMHGSRAINKRYFMSTGTQDIKPFEIDVVSGQQVDIHNDLLTDLKKMAIGATGVPAVAVDYMDEIEFATILKMTNTKTLSRANNIQTDFNGDQNDGITGLCIKLVRFNNPGVIPEEDLIRCKCVLRKNNTINNNISSDEVNNNIATVDNMLDVYYGESSQNEEITPFIRDEMKKRLVMMMSPSLPWGEMLKIADDVKLEAKLRKEKMAVSSGEDETSEE